MVKKFKVSKEEKVELLKESMSKTKVWTSTESFTNLLDLCEIVGIKQRIQYYNFIEKRVKKDDRTINNNFDVKKVIHDYGFIFKNDFEVRHVEKQVFDLYAAEIKEIRERKV